MTKEEILKDAASKNFAEVNLTVEDSEDNKWANTVYEAMQLYADQQTEEKGKEYVRINQELHSLAGEITR